MANAHFIREFYNTTGIAYLYLLIPKDISLNFKFLNKPTDLYIGITKPRGNAYRKQAVEIVKV